MNKQFPFQDPEQALDQRVADLVSRLTLSEKCAQLRYDAPAVEHLGVPAYNWWNECLHGVARNGRATVFPQAIAMAASWNPEMVESVASVISDEARAKHHEAARRGSRQQYQGLTFWTPNINIFRDPRWGRGQETWGEDPCLTGTMGAAFVRGLQGDHPKYLKTAACAKHFAVHSGPESLRHEFDARPSPRDFKETYLPAFRRLCDEGVESFMGAYNALYGEPCCGSRPLLTDMLRGEWGFEGHVVSDCWAVRDFHTHYKVTETMAESAAYALKNGCDLNCGNEYCSALEDAAILGLVSEAEIDAALSRVLRTRFRLGMFDPDEMVPYASIPVDKIGSPEHRSLAFDAALQSLVLLKNHDNLLPFGPSVRSILLAGPLVTSVEAMLGNYFGVSGTVSTVLEGFASRAPEGLRMDYRKGCPLNRDEPNPPNWAAFEAARVDVVVCCLGLTPDIEGEEGDAIESRHGGDRERIELPESQRNLVREIAAMIRREGAATRLVVVLFSGSAIAVPEIEEAADAIIHAWYPGEAGGEAVAAVILGQASPGGRLPVSFPRATECLPPFDDYSMQGRTYRFMKPEDILWPFGFGLDYTHLEWSPIQRTDQPGESSFHWTLQNKGERDGVEVIQCYHYPPNEEAPRLIGFRRVTVPAGEQRDVDFTIEKSQLESFDDAGEKALRPGSHRVLFARHAPMEPTPDGAFEIAVTP